MKILVAEDDAVSRKALEIRLSHDGYFLELFADGLSAWKRLQEPDSPRMVVLDWMMPGMDGIEVCKKIRAETSAAPKYVLLVTAKGETEDIVAGLDAGADDYLTKPFRAAELLARVRAGTRILELQEKLAGRIGELEKALSIIKQLKGLIPICSYCKKIRDDENTWQQLERYLVDHSDASFSHGICPDCEKKHFP